MNMLRKIAKSAEDDWLFALVLDALALVGACVFIYAMFSGPYATGFEGLSYYQQYGGENQ